MVTRKEFEKKVKMIMRRAEERKLLTPEHRGLAGYIESVGLRLEHPYLTEKEILRFIRHDPVFTDVVIGSKFMKRAVKRVV